MKATTHRVRFREFEFDVDTLELWRAGEAVHLPPKPSKTLALLVERAGSLVTREELQASVWSGTVVEFNQSLNTYVRLIRSTLGDDAESPTFIETVPRRGYRFVADVRPAGASDALSSSRRATGRMAIVAALAVLALGVWAGVALNNASASPARIAILPLQVLGADEADRLFADGLSEELITTLAGLAPSRMEVIGRASSVAFGRGAYGIEDVGRVLGADYVLEGSVRPSGDGYRVSARLVRTSDHVVVWSGQYDRDSGTLSAQEWLASHLASIVAPAVSVDSIAGLRREPAPQARVRWLMAQHLLNRGSPDEAARSLPLLEGVTDVDPAFALARVSLGRALMQLGRFDEADTALAVAFRLEPALPYAHLIRGQLRLRQWRLDDAERDLEYAVEHATGEGACSTRGHTTSRYAGGTTRRGGPSCAPRSWIRSLKRCSLIKGCLTIGRAGPPRRRDNARKRSSWRCRSAASRCTVVCFTTTRPPATCIARGSTRSQSSTRRRRRPTCAAAWPMPRARPMAFASIVNGVSIQPIFCTPKASGRPTPGHAHTQWPARSGRRSTHSRRRSARATRA